MSGNSFDVAIIGGGIAGVSIAAFLAQDSVRTVLLDGENSLAYHTTGRSAALFTPHYGPVSMQAFAAIAKPFFFENPYDTENPLVTPNVVYALVDEENSLTADRPPGSSWRSESQCLELVPFLRRGKFLGGIVDSSVASIDVHEVHSLYVKIFKSGGGEIFQSSKVTSLSRKSGVWEIDAGSETFTARTVVNAAGAWGDQVAAMAGISLVGLTPKRRTAVLLNTEQFDGVDFEIMPFVVVEPCYLYFQNFGAGRIMVSPADETPSLPCDAQPDELDIAICVARFEEVTTLKVQRIEHSWAGLRTFALDGDPVIGWDPNHEGFFWLVGQGGYGIFSSPAIGRYAASLVSGNELPAEYVSSNYDFESLSPARLKLRFL